MVPQLHWVHWLLSGHAILHSLFTAALGGMNHDFGIPVVLLSLIAFLIVLFYYLENIKGKD